MRWNSRLVAIAAAAPGLAILTPVDAVAEPRMRDIWSGEYVGLTAGAGFGAQIGSNLRLGNFLIGVEGEVKGGSAATGGLHGSRDVLGVDWTATGRGRAGFFVAPRVLVYGLAGYGAGGVDLIDRSTSNRSSTTLSGLQLGVGLEWKVFDQLSLRVDYTDQSLRAAEGGSGSHALRAVQAGIVFRF